MSWVVLDGAVGTAGLATAVVMTFDDGMFVVIGVELFLAAVIVCWLFSADAPPQVYISFPAHLAVVGRYICTKQTIEAPSS